MMAMSMQQKSPVEAFAVEGFVISIRPPTEHRLLTTLDVSHLSPEDYFAFLKIFKDRKQPIDELWKERELRGTSIPASHHRLFTREPEGSKIGKWRNTIRPSLFPSRFTNELKGLRTSILDFLNDTRYCIAVEESPTTVFSETGTFESQRKLYVIPFTHLSEINKRRKEWNERLFKLNKQIKNYLERKGPKGEPDGSYQQILKVLEIYGVRFATEKPQPEDEYLPPVVYKFSAHTIGSSPGLKERALKLQPPEEREEIESMIAESDNIILVSTLRKFYQEALASVKEVVDKWQKISGKAEEKGKPLTEKEEHRAKKASINKLEVIRETARDLGLKSLEDSITPIIDYVKKTKPGEVQVEVVQKQLSGRIRGLNL